MLNRKLIIKKILVIICEENKNRLVFKTKFCLSLTQMKWHSKKMHHLLLNVINFVWAIKRKVVTYRIKES